MDSYTITGSASILGRDYETSTVVHMHSPKNLEIGWDNKNVPEMLKAFPGTKVVGLFREPNEDLPNWGTSPLIHIPPDISILMRFKKWPINIDLWMESMPKARVEAIRNGTSNLYLCYRHEPEQGQSGGDLEPGLWRVNWTTFINECRTKSWRSLVKIGPIYTEYYAKKNASWISEFGIISSLPGVDTIGFDIYNGPAIYRTAKDMFQFPLKMARQYKKDLIIGEWGIERKGVDDGSKCAEIMIEHIEYLAQQPEAKAICWFYVGGDNLDNRAIERETLKQIILTQDS